MSPSDAIWLGASAAAAAGWAWLTLLGHRTLRLLDRLPDEPDGPPPGGWPRLSAIVPCRDEAPHVEAALLSLLVQDYPDLEVVAVDDRSGDATGAILDRLAARGPRLAVVHVAALPDDWLGKNHACKVGAARASGDLLLFTDGDVHFGPGALRRAVSYAVRRRLGHLVALPRMLAGGYWERAFVAAFAAMAAFAVRPWGLRQPGTPAFVGVGAFNLVRRDAYRAVGGHDRLRFEVVDDAKLGLLLRRSGVRQGAVDSAGLVSVRWQPGFWASMRGLMKNAFAALEYRWASALAWSAALAFLVAVPLAALLLAPHAAARAAGAAGWLMGVAVHGTVARRLGAGSGLEGLVHPACGLALASVFPLSAAAAALRGGIVWRGTRYPLAALRAGCLRVDDLPADRAVGWE